MNTITSLNRTWKTLAAALGIVLIAGMVLRARPHDTNYPIDPTPDHDAEVLNRLVKIGQYQSLLHQLRDGNVEDVRERLSLEIAANILKVRSSLGSLDDAERDFAQRISNRMAADEKSHP